MNSDGTLSTKRTTTRIDSVARLSIALLSLSRVLPAKDPSFNLSEFISYMSRIIGLCNTYTLESVVEFKFEFRRWITFWSLPWSANNRVIADTFLIPSGRHCPKGPNNNEEQPSKNVCRDFNKGVCSRAKCRFRHVCSNCGQAHAATACPSPPKP